MKSLHEAAKNTMAAIAHLVNADNFGHRDDPTSFNHLVFMKCEICTGRVVGEKGHRWLGYIQGVLIAQGHMTLEQAKEINK